MLRRFILTAVLLVTLPAGAADYILPVFALRVPGEGGSVWTSEVWVTNPGPNLVRVYEGGLIGRTTGAPPCLPIVQPSLTLAAHSTQVWSTGELSIGIGCPETAAGALRFHSEGPLQIASRIVNTRGNAIPPDGPLRGFGQEVTAYSIDSLLDRFLVLPGVVWHPNSCGPAAFDTNVFFANPDNAPVRISITVEGGNEEELIVDGTAVKTPFVFTIERGEFRQHRLAGAGNPMLPVCLPPVVGSFWMELDGPLSILGSVVDRSTGDARTVVPIESP